MRMVEKKMDIDEEAIKAYIGKPSVEDFYINAFKKYELNGFTWIWSSWALMGGIFFLLYRKLYAEASVFFIISILASGNVYLALMIWIASGFIFTFFVYKRYEKIRKSAKENQVDDEMLLDSLQELGGYHQWALFVAVGLNMLVVIAILYFGMAIANDPQIIQNLAK